MSAYRQNLTAPPEKVEPLHKIFEMDRGQYTIGIVLILAGLLHTGVAAGAATATLLADILAWNRGVQHAITDKLTQEYEITQEKPPEPPPPPEPDKEPPPPPPPLAKDDRVEEPPKDETPAPTPAQAAAVMTQEPAKDEPVDLTGNTFVNGTGDGTSFGAVSAAGNGKSGNPAKVVRNDGVPGGTGTGAAPPPPPPPSGPDKSRKAGLDGSADWNDCPFPAEADAEQIDEAFVVLQVNVGADGRPATISVVQDPGHGFGRQAKICAQRKSFKTALDHDGNPVAGQTGKFSVHFSH
jgi:protein TonB